MAFFSSAHRAVGASPLRPAVHGGAIKAGLLFPLRLRYFQIAVVLTALLLYGSPARPDENSAAKTTLIKATAPVKLRGQQSYQWSNAVMGGVEYATGIVINPKHPERLYTRCDTGGFFQLDSAGHRWIAKMDSVPFAWSQLFSAESIAVDANDPNVLYADTGGGQWGSLWDVLKTTDDGRHWFRTHLTRPDGKMVLSDAGGDEKPAGERIVCDPNDSRVVWFGTRRDGLFQSLDGAKTWRQVTSFPTKGGALDSVTFVTLDWKAGKNGQPTQTLYVGVHGGQSVNEPDAANGLYVSRDGGETWIRMTGGPGPDAIPIKGRLSADGTLYIACAGAGGSFWKYKNGAWTNITPPGFQGKPCSGCGVHPTDASQILTITQDDPIIFYTKDGGATWKQYKFEQGNKPTATMIIDSDAPWQNSPDKKFGGYNSDVAFDPLDPKTAYHTSFGGVFVTHNIGEPVLHMALLSDGREQMTMGDAVSPSAGAPLVSGAWDTGGFRHETLDRVPETKWPLIPRNGKGDWGDSAFEDTYQLDANPAHPEAIVAAGGWNWTESVWHHLMGDAAYSEDNGRTFHEFAAKPFADAKFGRIALGTDPKNVVWAPMGDGWTPVYFTQDQGQTWTAGQGSPLGTITTDGGYSFYKELAADQRTPGWFYLYDRRDGHFYRSEDGGATWKQFASLPKQQGVHWDVNQVRANPLIGGDVWVSISGATALAEHGLYHSADGGATWQRLSGVEWAASIAFGLGSPGSRFPALYLLGQIGGSRPARELEADIQLYRSDDLGQTWIRINDDAHQLAGAVTLTGGYQKPNRIFVCTGGRGVFYGQPVRNK